jgi:hypothetical protein
VKGFEGNTILLGQNLKLTRDSKVLTLKKAISERTGMDPK